MTGSIADGTERMQAASSPLPSSFRDPAGTVFVDGGVFKRAVTWHGRHDYDLLMSSGLYDALLDRGWLLPHEEQPVPADAAGLYKILVPRQIRMISYPYEWSFAQLKDAALLTLEAHKLALQHGMSLKDASAYNVQFLEGRPVFIDTLSFEENPPGPWIAYDQFCRHFLAPLLLMKHLSPDVNQFLRAALDGFPLPLASRALPFSTYFQPGPLLHLHLHARSQVKHAHDAAGGTAPRRHSADSKPLIADSLLKAIAAIELPKVKTEWIDYYSEAAHYSGESLEYKRQMVSRVVRDLKPGLVYDLGGNVGEMSRLVTQEGIDCVCYDVDPLCVNRNYLESKARRDGHMLPLLADVCNPSPPVGFELRERLSFLERARPDLVLALAVLHHLRITGNVPLARIAGFLAALTENLLIEFVPKSDPMVRTMLARRQDIFEDYTRERFEEIFGAFFRREAAVPIAGTERVLYLFRGRKKPE